MEDDGLNIYFTYAYAQNRDEPSASSCNNGFGNM